MCEKEKHTLHLEIFKIKFECPESSEEIIINAGIM